MCMTISATENGTWKGTLGGSEVGQNVTIVLIGCVNGIVTRGGGGPKIRKFCGRRF